MSFAAAALTGDMARSWSIGPKKMQVMSWSVESGDTSGTVTATALSRIDQVIVGGGLNLTSAPTYSGNVATLAFADPLATLAGQVICIGV